MIFLHLYDYLIVFKNLCIIVKVSLIIVYIAKENFDV